MASRPRADTARLAACLLLLVVEATAFTGSSPDGGGPLGACSPFHVSGCGTCLSHQVVALDVYHGAILACQVLQGVCNACTES